MNGFLFFQSILYGFLLRPEETISVPGYAIRFFWTFDIFKQCWTAYVYYVYSGNPTNIRSNYSPLDSVIMKNQVELIQGKQKIKPENSL
jgi:hypothetical protein